MSETTNLTDPTLESMMHIYSEDELTIKPDECAIIFDNEGRLRPIIQIPQPGETDDPTDVTKVLAKIRGVVLVQALTKALVNGDEYIEKLFDSQIDDLMKALVAARDQFEKMTNTKVEEVESTKTSE